MTAPAVTVSGLKELHRSLRRADKELPKTLRDATKDVAESLVAPAQARAIAQGGATRKMAPSIRAGANQSGAFIRYGGPKYPMAGGGEHGSLRTHGAGNPTSAGGYTTQFEPYNPAGYAIRPTIRDHAEAIRGATERHIQTFLDSL